MEPDRLKMERPGAISIRDVVIDPPLVLAPMAGITDAPFRRVVAEHGAGMVSTEMVSIQGLVRRQRPTLALCKRDPDISTPLSVQLFGCDPQVMAEAARIAEGEGAGIIDINAGCPVRKVVRQGAGAALLKNPELAAQLVEAVKNSVSVPVTMKLRLGWDDASINIVPMVRMLAAAGVDAVSIHARTAAQMYTGVADWSWISRVKEEVSIPVIGNGDVNTPSQADSMLMQTGCDAIMIGRASCGNPWLFSAIASRWGVMGSRAPCPDWNQYLGTILEHLELSCRARPKPPGYYRKIFYWYSRGVPDAAQLRRRLAEVDETGRMVDVVRDWVNSVASRGVDPIASKVPESVGFTSGPGLLEALENRTRIGDKSTERAIC